ncbi:guanine nucleotide-binding protein-like 1 isoform X2 [Anoplophora glabripennis]|uniref:guanine nucleotide-binding protein-like 1 isoform X2 n=1 Tax=Anoplophora glabripennis TaxID=217634 RepID=UPI0008737724|nr:guanine nucleotide-binding protein-like 1 isoform X2 [Anoplophora glabripennis]
MEYISCLIIFSAIYVLYCCKTYIRTVCLSLSLPGPTALPVLGNVLILNNTKKLEELGTKAYQLYGPFFRSWVSVIPFFFIYEPRHLKIILAGKNSQKNVLYKLLHNFVRRGIITNNGEKWKTHRKLIQPHFHVNILENYINTFSESTKELLSNLEEDKDIKITPVTNKCILSILHNSEFRYKIKMPQGRRKTPFSGKAKKEQLKAKKQSKQLGVKNPAFLQDYNRGDEGSSNIQKINFQPSKDSSSKPNKYALQFFKETKEEIAQRKEFARQSLAPKKEIDLEINETDYFTNLDFPKRPEWNFSLGKNELEVQENKYFTGYLKEIESKFDWKDLSLFELNLETWRQLWRVLEMSDVVLYIVDIRYAALMFPPSLYDYVTNTLKKGFILVLNKIDLAPASLVVAWKHYFQEKYPNLQIVMFTTLPGYNLIGKQSDAAGLQVRRRRGKIRMAAEGTLQILEECKKLVGTNVDLTSWENKIKEETNEELKASESDDEKVEVGETIQLKNPDTDYFEYEKFKSGVLTIGCIGQPNVGKSSLMNAIMGKKVVSVSKTPGHTKHFQTIYLTPNVKLCDCPGLVFPSKVSKPLQVLMGNFPIAQLREPFTTVKYLAERLDLVSLLRIDHPDNDDTWSAMDICDGWAKKRGYLTAKAARLDSYRAANSILRMALDGKICLCLRPPSYSSKKRILGVASRYQDGKMDSSQVNRR